MTNVKAEETRNPARNSVLWAVVVILLAAGIGAYYYFQEVAWSLRAAAGLILICILLAIGLQTTQGQSFWRFAKAARMEMRKVIWPTRQETIQTTLLVVAMVVIMALILWGVDSILMWAVGWFTGQHG